MLKLSSLGQKIGQLLAVPHHDGRLAHEGKVSLMMAVLNGGGAPIPARGAAWAVLSECAAVDDAVPASIGPVAKTAVTVAARLAGRVPPALRPI
jgi:hypothetical protein